MANVTVPTDTACDLIIASNAVPAMSLAYQENGDAMPHTFTRLNAADVVVQKIEGRIKPVAFRTTEGRSDVFSRQLIVNIDTPATLVPGANADRAPFDPLVDLFDTAPYVAVCDGHGRRWFASGVIKQGSYTYLMHEHLADVEFTEVSMSPVLTASPATP